jgi:hypothetical protein
MIHQAFTKVVIRRPNGRVEMIGRRGIHDPHTIARVLEESGAGVVTAVRHETKAVESRTKPGHGKPQTLAIHDMRR